MNSQKTDLIGNIWITSRIRMGAHHKFIVLDRLSHLALTVYSIALLGFSIFQPHFEGYPAGTFSSEISILLSFTILCASLMIWGLGLGQKARDHRDCYLALQRLYHSQEPVASKQVKYQEILAIYPNHTDLDNERFLFRKLIIDRAEISNANGLLSMGFFRVVRYIVLELACVAMLFTLFLLPLIAIVGIYALQ